MVGVIYLAMLGVAAIIGAIIGTLIGLLLSFTSLSPLIIGGTVGAIYVVPLIAAFITILLYPIPYERHSGLTLKETACLAGLFIGIVAAGVGLVACGLTPIIKVDSLSSLSTTVSSLLAMGATIPVLLIATAIGVAIVIELAKQAKEYISGKIMQAEKEPVTDTHEEPGSKMEEAKEEKTARNKQAVRECSKNHTRQVKEIKV